MAADIAFAPLPARAIADHRLTMLHLRALAAVAMHDRLGGRRSQGGGCRAGNKTLAIECGCNLSNLATAVADLGRYGYLESRPHPLNKRLRVLNVIYNDADVAFTKAANRLPTGNRSSAVPPETSCPPANGNDETSCPTQKKQLQNQELPPYNIFRETGIDSVETGRDNTSEEALLKKERAIGVGEWLARTEREIRKGSIPWKDLRPIYDQLVKLESELDHGTADHGRCYRMLEILGDHLNVG